MKIKIFWVCAIWVFFSLWLYEITQMALTAGESKVIIFIGFWIAFFWSYIILTEDNFDAKQNKKETD